MADDEQPERTINIQGSANVNSATGQTSATGVKVEVKAAREVNIQGTTTAPPSFRDVALVGVLAFLGAVLINIATSQLPARLQPYLWLSWPLALLVTGASIWVAYRQSRRTDGTVVLGGGLEQRNRRAMLQKVKAIWIDGLLEQSLAKELRIALDLTEQPDAVDLPLNAVVQELQHPPRILPSATPIINVFDQMSDALLILGAPGAGKTTLLLELARDLIARAEQDESHPIPVVFNLSSWAEKRQALREWLVEELNRLYDVPRKLAQEWVKDDTVLPLLDGLDEVAADYRGACADAINAYRQEHGLVPLVVCSRVADYEALTSRLRLQGAIVVQPLTKQQVDAYLERAGEKLARARTVLHDDAGLGELLDTPLMLSVVAVAYKEKPLAELQGGGTLDEQRRHLFDSYTEAMFERRSQETRYPPEQTMRWLAGLAQAMRRQAQSVFFIERLQPEWLPTPAARQHYVLIDRLVVGLGAGLSVGLVSGVASGLGGGLSGPLLSGLGDGLNVGLVVGLFGGERETPLGAQWGIGRLVRSAVLGYLVVGLGVALAGGLFIALGGELMRGGGNIPLVGRMLGSALSGVLGGVLSSGPSGALVGALAGGPGVQPRRIVVVETLHWSWSKALRSALGGLAGGLIGGLFSGLVYGLVGGLGGGLVFGLLLGLFSGLLWALITGLVFGLVFGLAGGLAGGEVETKVTPNQGIRRSARSALLSGLMVGGIFGLGSELVLGAVVGLVRELVPALLAGLIFGLAGALAYGGYACLSHLALRFVLSRNGSLPLRLVPFLDYCVERVFLRKVGGGYIFVHRLLMEHFASLYTEQGDAEPPKAEITTP